MNRFRRIGIVAVLAWSAVGLFAAIGAATAPPGTPRVVQVEVDGVVDPFVASYVTDAIAGASDADAVLITIDTPGGLDSAMRDITESVFDSEVPVITYVYPSGARAASAGTFILASGGIAAMAPGTNVGAAHPVGLAGATEIDKATNDAAAYIVSLAEARDRNAEWYESAVIDSVSISAEQALAEDVIDIIAPDIATLLDEVDGMAVPVAHGETATLDTAGAVVEETHMNAFVGFLHQLLNPDIAFIFFWLGLGLIILEFFAPGGIAGTVGAIMLILAIVAFGMLPIQLVGIALLVVSVVAFIVELKHPGVGAPAIIGGLTLIAGGLLLFDSSVPNAQVSPVVIVVMGILTGLFFAFVIRAAIQMRRRPSKQLMKELVGSVATVKRTLDPEGVVLVNAEEWSAVAPSSVGVGDKVTITAVDGLTLRVEPIVDPPVGDGMQTETEAEEGSVT